MQLNNQDIVLKYVVVENPDSFSNLVFEQSVGFQSNSNYYIFTLDGGDNFVKGVVGYFPLGKDYFRYYYPSAHQFINLGPVKSEKELIDRFNIERDGRDKIVDPESNWTIYNESENGIKLPFVSNKGISHDIDKLKKCLRNAHLLKSF